MIKAMQYLIPEVKIFPLLAFVNDEVKEYEENERISRIEDGLIFEIKMMRDDLEEKEEELSILRLNRDGREYKKNFLNNRLEKNAMPRMIYDELKKDLLKIFKADDILAIDDGDFLGTYKADNFNNYKDGLIFLNREGENQILDYYSHYWGNDEFKSLLEKFSLCGEWIDGCLFVLFRNPDFFDLQIRKLERES